MAKCENNSDIGLNETDWVEIDSDVAEWIAAVARCYDDVTEREVTEDLLRHGCKNYEEILGWDN